jgi:uncharacterized protein with NRDE domain
MCLILFAFRAHPDFPLVVAANRDESYRRPTLKAAFWQDHPDIFGGRDLDMGGTWMSLTRGGRFAAITNFRDGAPKGVWPRSRGNLAKDYLLGASEAPAYLDAVAASAGEYAGFSMLAGDLMRLCYFSNYGKGVVKVTPGVHGLSNHLLDTPWPKVVEGRDALGDWLKRPSHERSDELFDMLADRHVAPENQLPDTGVGIAREKQLGPKFIAIDDRYGTRASTVIMVDALNNVTYTERSFGARGVFLGEVREQFSLSGRNT